MEITAAQRSLLPTGEDVAFYEEHGWYVAPAVLTDESLDEAKRAVERHYAGQVTEELAVRDGYSVWRPGDRAGALRNDEFISLRNAEIRRFLHQPVIAAIGARLMRTPEARLFTDSLLYKPPRDRTGGGATGWHTDRSYWSTCTTDGMTTAWIPLHDVTPDRAPLTYLSGSHRWEGFDDLRSFKDVDLVAFEASLREQGREVAKASNVMRRGQVSFHHARTIHASEPNRAGLPRVSFALHLQPAHNRYRAATSPDGRPVVLPCDRMCRRGEDGLPDYTDPMVFPVLWSEAA